MTEKKKQTLSRRELLGGMGKLAYVAPTLTVLSLGIGKAHGALPEPPPPPSTFGAPSGPAPTKQKPRTESRTKKRGRG